MNKKILRIYYKSLVSVIFLIFFLWITLGFILILYGKSVDINLPQYLIRSVENEIEFKGDDIIVSEELTERLDEHEVWMQLMSAEGEVVYSYNTPDEIPQSYDAFELANYCLEDNRLPGYALFSLKFENNSNYGVILGCKSSFVNKISYVLVRNGKDEVVQLLILLLIIVIVMVIFSSVYFANKVSKPIAQISNDIEKIYINEFEYMESNHGIFSAVYEKIAWLNKRLKSSKRTREEWISNITHDIKTPLSSIKGYAELLAEDKYNLSNNEIKIYSNEILRAELVIEELVADLRLSEKLEEGALELRKTNVDLIKIINECVEEVPKSTIGNSEVIFDVPSTVVYEGDRQLLKRAFQNIIGNCFTHNDQGIRLNIKAYIDNNIVIIIEDNGKGISAEDCEHIFDRYYRGGNTSKIAGSGLGMAIANSAIQIHGGKILVESEIGKGTKFKIIL